MRGEVSRLRLTQHIYGETERQRERETGRQSDLQLLSHRQKQRKKERQTD
jgi:hypothetical protein